MKYSILISMIGLGFFGNAWSQTQGSSQGRSLSPANLQSTATILTSDRNNLALPTLKLNVHRKQDPRQSLFDEGESPLKDASRPQENLLQINGGVVNGGGGGGIKMPDGKVYTMAQAGLKFYENPKEDPFYVDPKIIGQAKQILKDLKKYCIPEYYGSCYKMIASLGRELSSNEHIYKKIEVVDPKLFDRVQREYQKFTGQLPIKGKFVMAAYTDKKTTLLFPDFFGEGIDTQTQAIYLIHEALFSLNPQITIEKVLRVEVAIVEILQEANLRTTRQLRDSFALSTSGDATPLNELLANYLEYLKDQGKMISFNQIFEAELFDRTANRFNSLDDRDGAVFQISPYIISQNKDIDSEFFRTFFKKQMRVYHTYSGHVTEMNESFNDLEFRGVWIFNKKTGEKFEIKGSEDSIYKFGLRHDYCPRNCVSFEELTIDQKKK